MKNQSEKKNHEQDKFIQNYKKWSIFYIDAVIRGILSFFIIGLILYAFLRYYFNLPFQYIFIIIFMVSIVLSPVFSKIKYGERIFNIYDKFLSQMENKFNVKNGTS